MTIRRDYCVYIYFRHSGVPCYVGQGTERRVKVHFKRKTNPHLWNIIQNAGGVIPFVKIREGLSKAEAVEIEIALIAAIGREKNGGPLVNQTDGGDGTVGNNKPKSETHKRNIGLAHKGRKRSPEQCAALSAAKKGVPATPAQRVHLDRVRKLPRLKPRSEESKEKQRLAMLGTKASDETKAKMSRSGKGRPKSELHRQRIGDAHRGSIRSEETRAKQRAAAAVRWARPGERERVSQQHANMTSDQKAERSERISKSVSAAFADPGLKQRHLEKMKEVSKKRSRDKWQRFS